MSLQNEITKFHGVSIPIDGENLPFGPFETLTQAEAERRKLVLMPGVQYQQGLWTFRLARTTEALTQGFLKASTPRINYAAGDLSSFAVNTKKLTDVDEDNTAAVVAGEFAGGIVLPNPATGALHWIKGNTAVAQDGVFDLEITPSIRTATTTVPPLIARNPYYNTTDANTGDNGIEFYVGCSLVTATADTDGLWYWLMTKGPGVGAIGAATFAGGNVLTASATDGVLALAAEADSSAEYLMTVGYALDTTAYNADTLVTHIPVWWDCP